MHKIICLFITILAIIFVVNAQAPKTLVYGNFTIATPQGTDFSKAYNGGNGIEIAGGIGIGKTLLIGSTGYIQYQAQSVNTLGDLKVIPIKVGIRRYLVGKLFVNGQVGAAIESYGKSSGTGTKFLYELANGYYIGRAFDNRIGGFMIAEVARLLKENNKKLPFGLYVVNAVQEEIGLRGAEMIARRLKPNIAIVTDVTHDTQTPMISKIIEGDVACGKGPSPCYGPAVHNKLLQFVQDVAEKQKIPLQMRAVSRSTGTDTDSFAYANDGCPSVLISIPLRYMHTTVEMLHKDDIDSTIVLMYETLLALTPDTNLSYL